MGEKNLRVPRGSWTHDLALARCANALPLVNGDSGCELSNFFRFICVCSCYWWPSLAPATVPQQYHSLNSTDGHNFIAAGFSVSLRPTVHTLSPILSFLHGNAHSSTSQATKMTSLQRPVNQTTDTQFIQSTMLYCESSQNLMRTERGW